MTILEPRTTTTDLWDTWWRDRTTEARNNLTAHYLPLVEDVARSVIKSLPRHVDVGDLVGAGCIGLMKAIERVTRDGNFEAFARQKIRYAIIDDLREGTPLTSDTARFKRRAERADGDTGSVSNVMMPVLHSLTTDHGHVQNTIDTADVGGDPDGFVSVAQTRSLVIEAIKLLTERDRVVLALYYRSDLGVSGIAELLGCSIGSVSSYHSQAVIALRTNLRRVARQPEGHLLAG